MNGKELFTMKREQFKEKVPVDQNDIFWTHLELLRKCKFVGKTSNFSSSSSLNLFNQKLCWIQQKTPAKSTLIG
jgi:hypothetical protein